MAQTEHFDATAIALHWTIAGLIIAAFTLGLTVDEFPEGWEHAVVNVHAILGASVLLLTFARVWWRLTHKPPPLPPDVGPVMRSLSGLVHFLLYVLMVLVPLIGVPTLLYRGRGLDFGIFQIPSPFERSREIFGPLTEIHELASYAMIGLAGAHILAALYHHFIRKDEVLLQMLRAKG
ncbi:MAG TPA: cytochrome b [Rhizomicrobium sp.]|nr:cytochrome b [Rhizomicrobium sp.]